MHLAITLPKESVRFSGPLSADTFEKIDGKILVVNQKDANGRTLLHRLVLAHDVKGVREALLTPGIDVNLKDGDGRTALFSAALYGQEDTVEMLLDCRDIQIDLQDSLGNTAFTNAFRNGKEGVLLKFLTHPNVEIDLLHLRGRPLLVSASSCGYQKVVQKLIAHPQIDINGKDEGGFTALLAASAYGKEKIVEMLLTHPKVEINDKNKQGNTALHVASDGGYEAVVDALMAHNGIEINARNEDGKTALVLAAQKEHDKVIEKLLSHPAIALNSTSDQLIKLMSLMKKNLNNQDPRNPGNGAFISLLPEFLLNQPIDFLASFFQKIEKFFEPNPYTREYGAQRHYHPYEAELLLLLKHPNLLERDPDKTKYLTTCLTSISRFIETGAQLSDEMLKTWGDIGFLTHGFRFWRYDTVGGDKSLITQFGFKSAPDSRPLNEVYGKGFLYEDKGSGAWVEFRRGYLLVTLPEKGTLVVR
ncbi:MAG: ankyrin repeat domain-containing protein, partial [Cyanobacteria bacterium]|nr:ankyrin repeat domain-containing protein [Cyanobacteriota bacterium]